MITNILPKDWRDLQVQVARILEECGFTVVIEKKVSTARGEAEIDVYAEETIKGRTYSILCECKNWNASVPQNVIHAFRTVVADIGAHRGYLITTSGYQSGAVAASELTNLDLLTWVQFQEQFCETWLENFFSPAITIRMDKLMGFTEPLVQNWMCQIPDTEIEVVKMLRAKYETTGWLAMALSTYGHLGSRRTYPKLPIRNFQDKFESYASMPDEILDAATYRELMNAIFEYGDRGIREFEEVRARNGV